MCLWYQSLATPWDSCKRSQTYYFVDSSNTCLHSMQLTDNKICTQLYLQSYLWYAGCKSLWVGIIRNITVYFTYLIFIFISTFVVFILRTLIVWHRWQICFYFVHPSCRLYVEWLFCDLDDQRFELLILRITLILRIRMWLRYSFIYSLTLFVVLLVLMSIPVINGVC